MTGRRVLLGVTGGIAAYKAVELLRLLQEEGDDVAVVLTEGATRFVSAITLAALTRHPVRTSIWDAPEPNPHIVLGQWAEILLIAPCTANTIAKLAHGSGADLLSLTALATEAPVVLAPAMHHEMWRNPAVQSNIATLQARGVRIVNPAYGLLAGGDSGEGRLASYAAIQAALDEVEAANVLRGGDQANPSSEVSSFSKANAFGAASEPAPSSSQDGASSQDGVTSPGKSTADSLPLAGKRILVTAGGTREPLDPVRVLTNRSSGKQGHAIARQALAQGAKVTLITTMPMSLSRDSVRAEVVSVDTAEEMAQAVFAQVSSVDAVIMAAAVADFRPKTPAPQKKKKSASWDAIELEPTTDILATLGAQKRAITEAKAIDTTFPLLIGFAAETENVEVYAKQKLRDKHLDLIIANNVAGSRQVSSRGRSTTEGDVPSGGFESDFNHVQMYDHEGLVVDTGLVSKDQVAERLCEYLVARLRERSGKTEGTSDNR